MKRLKHTLPQHILKTIYNSLINSYLNYGALCWGFTNSHIPLLQRKAIRIITNSKYNAHTAPLFKKLRILTFEDMVKRKLYKFYYRYTNKKLPHYFLNTNFVKKLEHPYDTRETDFQLPRLKHEFAENSLRSKLPRLLNEKIDAILAKTSTHSEFGFSLYVKNYYLSKYKEECTIPDCPSCGS